MDKMSLNCSYDFGTLDSKMKILLVDDDLINQKLIVKMLQNAGLKSELAGNGIIAIDMIKRKKYSLVVMDMQMPVMNGYQAVLTIRNELKSDIPIIAMSAEDADAEKDKCLGLGMNEFITKPFAAEMLYTAMHSILCGNNLRSINEEKRVVKKPTTNDVLDISQLEELSGNNKSFIVDILTTFVYETSKDIAQIDSAIKKKDYETIRYIAHKQRSSVFLVGLNCCDTILADIERLATKEEEMEEIRRLFLEYKRISIKAMVSAEGEIRCSYNQGLI